MNMLLYPNVIRECRVTILQIAHSLRGDGYIPIYKKDVKVLPTAASSVPQYL